MKGLDFIVNEVRKFHQAFFHPVADQPKPLDLDRAVKRAIWTGEEVLVEFIHQSSDNEDEFLDAYDKLMAGMEKAKLKSLGMEYPKNDLDKLVGQSDALVDGAYFMGGSFVEAGLMPQKMFDHVQSANMAKLGTDGKPILRKSDGKIMKPEGWEENHAPEQKIEAEVKSQIEQAQ